MHLKEKSRCSIDNSVELNLTYKCTVHEIFLFDHRCIFPVDLECFEEHRRSHNKHQQIFDDADDRLNPKTICFKEPRRLLYELT